MNGRGLVLGALAAALIACGCNPTPRKIPCETYVAGSFTPDNHYALSVEGGRWPNMNNPSERIELTLFLSNTRTPSVIDLVHVLNSQELDRWTLHVPASNDHVPTCIISVDPKLSTCGASLHVIPQEMGGYYYLQSKSDPVEAGMSFVLCH